MTVASDLATAHGVQRKLRLRVEGIAVDLWQDSGDGYVPPATDDRGQTPIFADEFGDATVAMTQHAGSGSIAESGGKEVFSVSGDCNWWEGVNNAPSVYTSSVGTSGTTRFETVWSATTGGSPGDGARAGVVLWSDDQNAYFFEFRIADRHLNIASIVANAYTYTHVASDVYPADPNTTPLQMRVEYVHATKVATFYYKSTSDWTLFGSVTMPFAPTRAGLFASNYTAFPAATASANYFRVTDSKPSGYCCLLPPDEVSTSFDLGEMKCGLSAMTFEVLDVKDTDGTSIFGKLWGAPARWDNSPHYRIAAGTAPLQQIEANATNIPVKWTDAAAAAGTIYVGRERIAYGNVLTSNTFTECNRGMYPAGATQIGRVISRPQEGDSETIPAVGTVPFSYTGARVLLDVITYDNSSQTWNSAASALTLWAGRLDQSVRYVKGRWQLTCKSITDELDREVCDNLRSAVPTPVTEASAPNASDEPVLINLLDASPSDRSLTITEEGETTGGAMGGWYITIPQGVYTHSMLTAVLNDHANRTKFGSPETSFQFYVGEGRTTLKSWAYSITTWDTRSVWITSGHADFSYTYMGTNVEASRSHLCNALGFGLRGRWNYIVSEPSGLTGQRWGHIDAPHAPFAWYQPAASAYMALAYGQQLEFVSAQESGHGAFVTVDALVEPSVPAKWGSPAFGKPTRPDSTGGIYVARYTAHSYEIASAGSFSFSFSRWTLGGIPSLSYSSEDWLGWRVGDDPLQLRQACVPIYSTSAASTRGPYEMLLNLLVSTGTPGLNGAYDILPHGWGLAIEAEFVDVDSFIAADAEVMPNDLAQRPCYVISGPTSWSELLAREAKLFGFAVVWSNGKLTCKNVLTPAVDSWTVTLSDSTRKSRQEKPTLDIPSTTVVNRYQIKATDRKTGKALPLITITDADSKEGMQATRAIELDHPGLPTERGAEALGQMLKTLLVGGRGSMLRYPCPVVDVSLQPSLSRRVHIGDVVRFSSSFVPDVQGTGTMGTTCYALVTKIGWTYSNWCGNAQLVLLTTTKGYGDPWAPSALVNTGAANDGWDSADCKLYVSPLHFGKSGDDDDGARFKAGHFVVVLDACPSDVNAIAHEGPFELRVDYENTGKYLQFMPGTTIASYNSAREWVVEACNWGTAIAAQRLLGTWHANATTSRFTDGNTAQRWGK